ncbi:MAG: aminotransferase class I/II-fold pyridoxal phosphate-dependent enzyme [Gammaproteobacteria bacterium]
MKDHTFVDGNVKAYFDKRTPKKTSAREYIFGKKQPGPNSTIVNDNDYLRLSNAQEVVQTQAEHLSGGVKQVMMSRYLITGNNLHLKIEKQFADFLSKESVLITQSGYVANMGLLQAISNPDTIVYVDYFIHESFRAGLKSTGAKSVFFQHNSAEDLLEKIKVHGSGIILVESINSALGTVCPLEAMVNIRNTYGCVLVVDESHTLGLYGECGSGLSAELGLVESVDFITASLSKTFCTRAGLIAGKEKIIQYIQEISPVAIFSSAILEYDLIRLKTMLKVIKEADEKRRKLMHNAVIVRSALLELGYNIPATPIPSPIISLVAGPEDSLCVLRAYFDDRDIFASVFYWPATPKNRTLHRFLLHSDLSSLDVKRIIEACKALKDECNLNVFRFLFSKNSGEKAIGDEHKPAKVTVSSRL